MVQDNKAWSGRPGNGELWYNDNINDKWIKFIFKAHKTKGHYAPYNINYKNTEETT